MGVGPDDFKDHSERVENDYSDEVARRSAISRGYYSAFHFVREHGDSYSESNFTYGRGDHGRAKDFLRSIGEVDLADDLHTLQQQRKTADYDIDEELDELDMGTFRHLFNDFMLSVKQVL